MKKEEIVPLASSLRYKLVAVQWHIDYITLYGQRYSLHTLLVENGRYIHIMKKLFIKNTG